MAQRVSGYGRHNAELYPTPFWVIEALAEHLKISGRKIWEPACGTGQMLDAFEKLGAAHVIATDLYDYPDSKLLATYDFLNYDFLSGDTLPFDTVYQDIITNPPYGQQGKMAEAFIEHGLRLLPSGGCLSLLLQVDFDSGSTRSRFFRDCPHFAGKVVLTKRIKWFEPPPEKKLAGPSTNHSWFTWIKGNNGSLPRIHYAPTR